MFLHPPREAGVLLVCLLAVVPTSFAQVAPGTAAPPGVADAGVPPAAEPDAGSSDAGAALSPEELAELEAALGADASKATPATPTEAPGAAPRGLLGSIQSFNPDLSLILDVALAGFTSEEPLQTGGHDPRARGFNFQQLEMSVGAAVDPYFRFDAYIVFSQFGVEVEEAYAKTLNLPLSLQARAGQFLTRFGRINPTHPHSWDFVDQPFMLGRIFGGEGNRGLGVELSWLAPLPWYVELVGSATDATGAATARSFFGGRNLGVRSPFDVQFTGAVKQFFPLSDDLSLLWGLSYASGPNPTGHRNRTEVFGTDLYLKFRPISVASASDTLVALQAEAFYRRRQIPSDVLQDGGAYAQVLWKFSRNWGTAARYEVGTPAFDLSGSKALDNLDPEWTELRHRVSTNVTFWLTEFSRLRLQGAVDLVGWRLQPEWSTFLQLEVLAGAHGAHTF